MVTADMVDANSFQRLSDRFQVRGVPLIVANGEQGQPGALPEAQMMRLVREAVGA